ncbi:MAG: AMP-binding protein [Firmicutes bacterium]|nr:AMP-binding protein [Bacillota bacterium]
MRTTLGSLLYLRSREYPDNEVAVFPDEGIRWTYREFEARCVQVAKALLAIGVEKGDKVAVWATNKPEWLQLQFATAMVGAVLVTVNTNYKLFELEYLLKQADVSTLVLMEGFKDTNYVKTLYELVPELVNAEAGSLASPLLPKLKNVVFLGNHRHPGMYTWEQLLSLASRVTSSELCRRQELLSPDDVVNIQYTSGTTGFPKGAMLSHYNIINNAYHIGRVMRLTSWDRLCIPVPFFHCFGCVLGTLACITHGSTIVALDHFSPKRTLEIIEAEHCTGIHGVPTMFITMLEHPNFPKTRLSTLRTGIMAGSPCPEEVMRAVMERMGVKEITIAYGQTEASPVITMTDIDDELEDRVATVGRPLPGVEVKIVDPETGAEVGPGAVGELCTRGYHVMKGYYKDPEGTSAAIDSDGWLHTGDLAVKDERGYYRIVGRLKDMIIRGGENIYPRELEEYLHRHPKVSEAQVVGVPSQVYGEEVFAFIKLKPGTEAVEEEIIEYMRKRISRHKVPRYVRFVSDFPMTASGKVQKYKLRELAASLISVDGEGEETETA